MTHSLNLKQSLFLVFFTILVGSHLNIFKWELILAIRGFFYSEMISGATKLVLNERGIISLLQLSLSLVIGLFLFPWFVKHTSLRFREKLGFSFITYIPLLIFADTWFFKMFAPGSSYLHNLVIGLYFTPLFLIIGLYILPKFITLTEYNPAKAFKGGLLACLLCFPFVWLYDTLFNQYPFYLSVYSEWLRLQPEENHIYYFIGYLIGHYSTFETYIGSTGLIWHCCIWFIASGVSAWFAYFVIY
ncbi:hypothetical protein [Kiloniella litopenaei]|uniref:hypothetical protein n=1 Tax=Kiloniella litopenaei TaxID=1549748 RepID=UPI003BABF668